MSPIDLPPDSLFAIQHAERCRPAVRESYLSRPDDSGHDHEEAPFTAQPPPFPAELTVPSVQPTDDGGAGRLRRRHAQQRDYFVTAAPNPYDAYGPLAPAPTAAPE